MRKRGIRPRKGTVKHVEMRSQPVRKAAHPGRGRPSRLNWPEPPSQSPERVAEIVLRAKPKAKWRYMEDAQPDAK